jgi:hemoglobin
MDEARPDIATRADILRLTTTFYERAFRDELIGPIFTDVAHMDLEEHLPVICNFWATILLDERSYRGGAFAPHARIHQQVPLTAQHFRRWLATWQATVDDLFAGPVAERAKFHAARTADAFHGRLAPPPAPAEWVHHVEGNKR